MFATQAHLQAALIVFVLSVAIIDWCTHRIPNVLCGIGAMLALTLQTALHGEAGLLSALGGALVGFGMFLPFYVVRAFGAGDVKAMATVGMFVGASGAALAVGATLISGAVIGVLMLSIKPEHARATLYRLLGLVFAPVASMRQSKHEHAARSRQRFPYGIAIACGTAVALLVLF